MCGGRNRFIQRCREAYDIGVPKEVVLEWIHKIDPFYSAYGKDYYRIVVEYLEMIKIN